LPNSKPHPIIKEGVIDHGQGSYVMLELDKAANVEIAKLVHAEELAFHIRNRRNKQLGLGWLRNWS
jgi:hypothetical protein